MANEEAVYSFEENFLDALRSIVTITGVQSVFFGDTDTHKLPRVEVNFEYGGADQLDRAITSDGRQYLRKHTGTISASVFSSSKASHYANVAKVRTFFSWNIPTLVNVVLPYYQVQSVFETGSQNGNGEEKDFEIVTDLNFDVIFQIVPGAFDNTYNFDNYLSYNGVSLSYNGNALSIGSA